LPFCAKENRVARVKTVKSKVFFIIHFFKRRLKTANVAWD
jgi:hypothetical protein